MPLQPRRSLEDVFHGHAQLGARDHRLVLLPAAKILEYLKRVRLSMNRAHVRVDGQERVGYHFGNAVTM